MSLAPGVRVGPYEILSPLGSGGMGEVYRARDTKLGRDIALKILPDLFATDPERIARFHREAQLLASLNHPHIAAIYGVEESHDVRALVLELVEGPTLADRIAHGPMPLDEAVPIARQVADALDAAHEKGVIHRDLKPSNVKVTPDGRVKVLDFGLAKLIETPGGPSGAVDLANSPTLTSPAMMTGVGMILGTAAYMSPEQAKGRVADKRSDIWAFGVVFYEMLSGTRLHSSDSSQETIASILRDEPEWTKVPAQAHRLLKRCLEKDPQQRPRHIGDVMLLLDDAPAGRLSGIAALPPAPVKKLWLWPAVAAGILVVAGAVAAVWAPWRSQAGTGQAVRFEIGPADKMTFVPGAGMKVSPDGHWLVFPAIGEDGATRYWLRSLDRVEARALPGTDIVGGPSAFWSWDSRQVIFAANNKLKKIDIQGGAPQTIADVPGPYASGITWSREGVIVVGVLSGGPLLRVSASGGVVAPVTALEKGESDHRSPQFLPDGRHFLYQRISSDPNQMGVYVGSIDAVPDQQSLSRLLASDHQASYAASPTGGAGHLVFMRDRTLMAQPFDPVTMALSGEPVQIAEGVDSWLPSSSGNFSVSDTGTLVYRGAASARLALIWFDQQGTPGGTLGEPGEYANPAVSPDGTRVAVAVGPAPSRDIWILDVGRGTATRFTFDPALDDNPVWSPDGKQIVFSSTRAGRPDLYVKPADGSSEERLLFKSDGLKTPTPTSWSRDGRYLLFSRSAELTPDIWALPMQGEAKPIPVLQTPSGIQGQFSPDGRWFAYASVEAGPPEVYVRPFSPEGNSGIGAKWVVSKGASAYPRWRADGKELFYTSLNSQQMAVDIDTSRGFQAGTPRRLFNAPPVLNVGWDLAPDGKRFLLVAAPGGVRTIPFTVVLNWTAALKK